jgi:hypothetical protein
LSDNWIFFSISFWKSVQVTFSLSTNRNSSWFPCPTFSSFTSFSRSYDYRYGRRHRICGGSNVYQLHRQSTTTTTNRGC